MTEERRMIAKDSVEVLFKDFSTMRDTRMIMRNLDQFIDPGMSQALKEDPGRSYGRHTAWDFHGYVWFDGNLFYEEVWQHHRPVKTLSALSLPELMQAVNSEFGSK